MRSRCVGRTAARSLTMSGHEARTLIFIPEPFCARKWHPGTAVAELREPGISYAQGPFSKSSRTLDETCQHCFTLTLLYAGLPCFPHTLMVAGR